MKTQTKIPPCQTKEPSLGVPPNGDLFCVVEHARAKPFIQVPLTEREYQALLPLQTHLEFKGLIPREIVAITIREKSERAAAPDDSCGLENATAANNALMQLLCENIEFQRIPGQTSEFGCETTEGGTLCFGILQLVQSCRERLARAMEGHS